MARKFITAKEHALIRNLNKELMQRFIGQEVHYYAIDPDSSVVDDFYGESIQKSWFPPVMLNALVDFDNPATHAGEKGMDSDYELSVFLHVGELEDRNLSPLEGDFVEFGEVMYEITSVTTPDLVFGQVNNRVLKRLACVAAREGQFSAGGSTEDGVNPRHPVNTPRSRNVRD